jgi:hypothetical protein
VIQYSMYVSSPHQSETFMGRLLFIPITHTLLDFLTLKQKK